MKKFLVGILALILFSLQATMLFSCGLNEETNTDDPAREEQTVYCTVTFNSNGGDAVESVQVKKGEKVIKPSLSTKQDATYDYELKSWQSRSTDWDFETNVVMEDIELVAFWEVVGTSKQFLPE